MKPFDNVVVSATEPRSKVWIKHKYVKYNGTWQNITYGENGEVQSNSKRLTTDKIKIEKGNYKLDNLNNPEISPVAIAKFNDESFVELKANIKFPYELVVDDTFNQISLVFKKTNDGVITSGDVKNFEILSYENDILVKDDGVYNSVLTKNIKTGIEIKTNKKVDGKDIYYKKINLGIGPNATSKAYSIGINFSNIVDANVFVKGSANCFKLPFLAQDAQEFINYYFQSNQIIIQAGKDRSKYNLYLDIYYTK